MLERGCAFGSCGRPPRLRGFHQVEVNGDILLLSAFLLLSLGKSVLLIAAISLSAVVWPPLGSSTRGT
jgi:hypothetical protein